MGTDIWKKQSAAEASVSFTVATTKYARRPETASISLSEPENFLCIFCFSHKILVGKPKKNT
jgi:hypothetical protein